MLLYSQEYLQNKEANGDRTASHTLSVRHIAMHRNKRCLLTYLYHRMRRLRQARWELGSILPPELHANLINPEIQWFHRYSRSLATYMRSIGDEGFNILNDMTPPKSLYIEVIYTLIYRYFYMIK